MENWNLGWKVRLGRKQVFAGNECKLTNLSLLDAEPAEHNRVREMTSYCC